MTTKITTNYHTHTYLCKHAVGTIEDYIKRAIDLGYEELGFSDHFPFPKILSDAIYSLRMSEEDYVKYYYVLFLISHNKQTNEDLHQY